MRHDGGVTGYYSRWKRGHFFRVNIKASEPRPAKGGGESGICCVTARCHQDASGTRDAMPGIVCVP